MLRYRADLRDKARQLRSQPTDSEAALRSRLRRKQLLGVQFYRQKPIGNHIVDFFAPRAGLVVEVDGSQHATAENARRDTRRDAFLSSLGLKVLRFNSREVLKETVAVVGRISDALAEQIEQQDPPWPPFHKRGKYGAEDRWA